jgi:hypothetical protein
MDSCPKGKLTRNIQEKSNYLASIIDNAQFLAPKIKAFRGYKTFNTVGLKRTFALNIATGNWLKAKKRDSPVQAS